MAGRLQGGASGKLENRSFCPKVTAHRLAEYWIDVIATVMREYRLKADTVIILTDVAVALPLAIISSVDEPSHRG